MTEPFVPPEKNSPGEEPGAGSSVPQSDPSDRTDGSTDAFSKSFWDQLGGAAEAATKYSRGALSTEEADQRATDQMKIDRAAHTIGLEADIRMGIPEHLDRCSPEVIQIGKAEGIFDVVRIAIRSGSGGASELLNPLVFDEPIESGGGGRGSGSRKKVETAVRTSLRGAPQSALSEEVDVAVDTVLQQREPGVQSFEPHFQYRGVEIPAAVIDTLKLAVQEDINRRKPVHVTTETSFDSEEALLERLKFSSPKTSSEAGTPRVEPLTHPAPLDFRERDVFSHAKIVLDRAVLAELRSRGLEIGQDTVPAYSAIKVDEEGIVSVAFRAPTTSPAETLRIACLKLRFELDGNRFLQAVRVGINPDYVEAAT